MNEEALIYLKETARDTRELLLHIREVVKYVKEAESEVPEKMRRFIIMYFHDMHDLRDLYHSHDSDAGGAGRVRILFTSVWGSKMFDEYPASARQRHKGPT